MNVLLRFKQCTVVGLYISVGRCCKIYPLWLISKVFGSFIEDYGGSIPGSLNDKNYSLYQNLGYVTKAAML